MDEQFHGPLAAIYLGQHEELRNLLSTDPGLATRESSCGHQTLLQYIACEASKIHQPVESAIALVEAGASIPTPLVSAAGCGSTTVLQALLDLGGAVDGTNDWTPLDEALYWANRDIVDLLRARGASTSTLRAAAGTGELDLITTFFDDAEDQSLLPHAGPIASPFVDTVPVDRANDPADIVDHAFVMSVNCGQALAADALLQRGARINAVPPGYHWRGTALHAACWRGDSHLVTWLIEHGADPTIHDGLADSDAAGWADHHGHPQLVKLLEAP